MHRCNYCSYQSSRKYNLSVHERNKHGIERAPKTISVGPSRAPTTSDPHRVPQSVPQDPRFQPYHSPPKYPATSTVQQQAPTAGVPQTVSTDLFNKYKNALVDTIRVKENLRNENIELVRHRDETLDKMSNDFARLYHRYKDSRKEIKELLKCQ